MGRSEPPASGPPPSVPDLLAPPVAPPPAEALVQPRGWQCPSCHRVYAPWVACCGTCGPRDADSRTEITEGGFETTSQAMRRAGIKPEDVL